MRRVPAWIVVAVLCVTSGARADDLVRSRRTLTLPDGVVVTLHRVRLGEVAPERPSVVLVPDLGTNGRVFDLGGRGLAPYLAALGRDVFILEPGRLGPLAEWEGVDLPATLEAVRQAHPGRMDLVGWGYGGSLAIAALAHEPSLRRVVALSTPVLPEVPNPIARALLAAGGALGSLGADPERAAAFELLFAKHGHFPRGVLARLRDDAFDDLGPSTAKELLAWMEQGDLPLPSGTVRGQMSALHVPTLLVMPLRDNWAHPEFASPIRRLAPGPIQPLLLSELDLLSEDYTHLSMLQGTYAPLELFPRIAGWLAPEGAP